MELLSEDHDNFQTRMLAGELFYILLSLEKVIFKNTTREYQQIIKEFMELDMVDMSREKCLELFHECVRRATTKEERALFQNYADKLEVFLSPYRKCKLILHLNRERIAPNCGLLTRNGSESHCIGNNLLLPFKLPFR